MPIALRIPIALVLSIVCLAVPAWVGIDAGNEGYERGEYPTTLREFTPPAKQGVVFREFGVKLDKDSNTRNTEQRVLSVPPPPAETKDAVPASMARSTQMKEC